MPSGQYLDGKSSLKYDVDFKLHQDGIKITGAEIAPVTLEWGILNKENSIYSKDNYHIRFGQYPQRVIIIEGPENIRAYDKGYLELFGDIPGSTRKSMNLLVVAGLTLVLTTLLFITQFSAITRGLAKTVPEDIPESIGNMTYRTIITQFGDNINSPVTDSLHRVFLHYFPAETLHLKIIIIDSDMVNALALPGGRIIVFRGLLEKLPNADSYFALLAHETGHHYHNHFMRKVVENFIVTVALSALIGDFSDMSEVIAGSAGELTLLAFSRETEREADEYALEFMRDKGFSSSGLIDLFAALEAESDMPESMAFLSTHPLTEERVEWAKASAAAKSGKPVPDNLQSAFKDLKIELDLYYNNDE
jgi:Zn-dependent protease with chaperone function